MRAIEPSSPQRHHTPEWLPPHLIEVVDGLPPQIQALVESLPKRIQDILSEAPVYSARPDGAALVSRHCFPLSARTLEVWPLPWQRANGKAVTPTIALLAVACEKLSAAPVVMGGRRTLAQQHQAA